MGAFLYFLGGRGTVNERKVKEAGLGYLIDHKNASLVKKEDNSGPDGVAGCYFAFIPVSSGITLQSMIDACKGKMRKSERENVWIGLSDAHRPAPEDLERSDMVDESTPVELSDGNKWLIPIARYIGGSSQFMAFDRVDGEWVTGGIMPKFRQLWEDACAVWDRVFSEEPTMNMGELLDIVARTLTHNYRIGVEETGMLNLFVKNTAYAAAYAMCDWDKLEELKKKQGLTGVLSTAGEQE